MGWQKTFVSCSHAIRARKIVCVFNININIYISESLMRETIDRCGASQSRIRFAGRQQSASGLGRRNIFLVGPN